jgi:hypothetical protein
MHEAKIYRDRAAHALLKARKVKEPELRVTFETLAAGYEALAKDAERLAAHALTDEANVPQADKRPLPAQRVQFEESIDVRAV